MKLHHLKSESGSLPLVMLAAIILGGVVVVLFGVVRSGQQSVAHDRNHAQAIHVADTGIQQAYQEIRALDPDDPSDLPACGGPTDPPCTGTLEDGNTFEWTYEQIGAAEYRILSHGTSLGVTRALSTTISADVLFDADIIARSLLDLRGVNVGGVSVATFCNADIRGAATDGIDELTLLDWDETSCSISSNPPHALDEIKPFPTADGPEVTNLAAEFCADPPSGVEFRETLPPVLERGTTYCAKSALSTHTLSDLGTLEGDDRVVKVYFYDETFTGNVIELGGNDYWNWPNPTPADHEATDLQIWVANGGGDVYLYGNSRIAATITAPYSTCRFVGNNSQVKGAIFCNIVETRGSFTPDALARSLRDGELMIQGIDEEPPRNS